MKTTIPAFATSALLAIQFCLAQQPADEIQVTEAKIVGNVSDGTVTPPPPKPAPIPFVVETTRTTSDHVVEPPPMEGVPAPEGKIKITVQRVKDPGLPDPPQPPPPLSPDDPAVTDKLREFAINAPKSEIAFVSATVYNHQFTYFRCFPNGNMKSEISGWSNLDFNHFSGFATFQTKDSAGQSRQYSLIMGIGNEDTKNRAEFLTKHGRIYNPPEIPVLPDLQTEGPAFLILNEEEADSDSIRFIEGMHYLYRAEGNRLAVAYEARVKAHEEQKAYLLAHPPKPKDISVQFWKREKPTAKTQTQENP